MKNIFAGRGPVIAAASAALILGLGIGLTVANPNRSTSDPTVSPAGPVAATTTSASPVLPPATPPAATAAPTTPGACAPSEASGQRVLPVAPKAVWEFQGTIAYPTSADFGPTQTDNGVRKCFKHSVEGALFAATNASVQGADTSTVKRWLDYVATGPGREELLAAGPGTSVEEGGRISIAGYRVLSYTGNEARIDVAIQGLFTGRSVSMSAIYDLVWQDNDWRLMISDPKQPIQFRSVPGFAGYVPWGP